MSKIEYPSVICEYCMCTDSGTVAVGTGPYNLCEGVGCADALEMYNEEHPDETLTMEEAF